MKMIGSPFPGFLFLLCSHACSPLSPERSPSNNSQALGSWVCLLASVFLLICGSAFGATTHGAFMTLPPYPRTREGEARQLGSGPTPCRVGKCREEMPSSKYEGRIEHVGHVHRERW